jgi:hypothetical protein
MQISIAQTLNRQLYIETFMSEQVKPLETKRLCPKSDKALTSTLTAQLLEALATNDKSITTVGNEAFKEAFAHSKCHLLFEGMFEVFDDAGLNPKGMVFISDKSEAAHYAISFMAHGKTYYLDAYGVFTSTCDIEKRYVGTVITHTEHFEPNYDEHTHYDEYRDGFLELNDNIRSAITGEIEEDDLEEICEQESLLLNSFCHTLLTQIVHS